MHAALFALAVWRTSSRSNGIANCAEVAVTPRAVGLRDTKNRGGGTLVFAGGSMVAFLSSAKQGEFDLP
ncbi:DUF397 domain-containing protein [Solihabitans fulvus]|uniref:DUF397 domain-containing protein n=1 Tax=Solihabitans fulvus TaxID=1892852 RepID=A0A5B2X5M6_9PSEU|nr:DUF397 domain-containing protein [Solihabitans fulvus]KAA2258647.1 DUF397 domain-containing protein [Solihabitans fulvus]